MLTEENSRKRIYKSLALGVLPVLSLGLVTEAWLVQRSRDRSDGGQASELRSLLRNIEGPERRE